jgi:hypothetical protein
LKGEVKDMLMNQIKQVKHHADELTAVAKKSKNIEPWILTKTQRAATDLSDVTHYLDGELSNTKMAKGGETKFSDKVSAVSKRLEGTHVPAKYRKEYGKRYGKKTAQEAAQKIVGARVAKYERMR